MSAYRKGFDETKHIYFLIKGNEIWGKVKNSLRKEFDNEPVYNEKYLKAKIKSYNGIINTNFHKSKIPKSIHLLSVILIDSVFRTGKKYYPKVYLEEFKCVVNKKRFLSILLTIWWRNFRFW